MAVTLSFSRKGRARDDLVRRNQYLQKEILREKEDFKKYINSQKLEYLISRKETLQKEYDEATAEVRILSMK